jgi:glycosyltransferase involved in cell wall biosynthesis
MAHASIIIPAFNAAPFLRATIESALAQTRSAAQVIVVDDGSSDDTGSIASQFGDVVWLVRQENAGVSAARNHGARIATAEWMLFLDADDLLRPDALEHLLARAAEGDFGVVYGPSVYFSDDSAVRRVHGKGVAEGKVPAATHANFWKSVIATPGAALVRRDVFERVGGFDPAFNTTADRDFWMRAGMFAEFGFVNAPVIEKREHGGNMSGDKSRARQQAAEVQLSFLAWCERNQLSLPGYDVRQILERNLERAMDERAYRAAEWLIAEADRRGLDGELFKRARSLLAASPIGRELRLRVRSLFSR